MRHVKNCPPSSCLFPELPLWISACCRVRPSRILGAEIYTGYFFFAILHHWWYFGLNQPLDVPQGLLRVDKERQGLDLVVCRDGSPVVETVGVVVFIFLTLKGRGRMSFNSRVGVVSSFPGPWSAATLSALTATGRPHTLSVHLSLLALALLLQRACPRPLEAMAAVSGVAHLTSCSCSSKPFWFNALAAFSYLSADWGREVERSLGRQGDNFGCRQLDAIHDT